MNKLVHPASHLEGTVIVPGDKSVSHRAALLNSIAHGTAHVSNFCVGDDRVSMLRCLRGLGAEITEHSSCPISQADECFEVHGKGISGLSEPAEALDAGNSGTTMRLVAGLSAGQPFLSVLTGDDSLRSRPMGRIVQPLTQMGASIMGREGDTLAPLAIRGGDLSAIHYTMPVASAQLKSSVLIAGLYADGETVLEQPAASRDHTERMLTAMGARLKTDGLRLSIQPSELKSTNVRVPGDVSAAAFWIAAACSHPNAKIRLPGVGVNPTRTGVIEVLRAMGARVRFENVQEEEGEPVADIVAESSDLVATEIGGEVIPTVIDELPVLAVAACFARGTTVIRDAAELRVKESDRISATVEALTRLGARVRERPDGMVVHGGGALRGAEVRSHGDHRIAIAMAIAGLMAEGDTVVEGADAASVSYPDFWNTLESLAK